MTHDGGSLKFFFEGGAMLSKKMHLSQLTLHFFCIFAPPCILQRFFSQRPVHSCIGLRAKKMGGMLKAFGMSSITLCMGWNGLRCRGNQKNGGEGERGRAGVSMAYLVKRSSSSFLCFAFHAEMYKRDRGNDELEC